MLFNSIDFAIFLPIVFVFYWFITHKNLRLQNFMLVCASYLFYGWWDWRFLLLILFSTVVDFLVGLWLNQQENESNRKKILAISVVVNLGFLGFFKYFNFFLDNFKNAFQFFGHEFEGSTLAIILPVGISFYTFQSLSYTIDVYRRQIEPAKDFIAFAAFISFFPQLVAGPIERATHLLPQFFTKRIFNYDKAVNGLRQILWGLFKKVVVADNCAEFANIIFNNHENYSGSMLFAGALFFTFQIYCDFSGYSDIAIGTARLFGVDLMRNFAFPYFSRNIAEFWRRWHISLSTWFRDYLYIPLGGSKGGLWFRIRNILVVFILSGFWHGANWTFIIWGLLNALYFLPTAMMRKSSPERARTLTENTLPSLKDFIPIAFTFILTVFAWIFFRSENVTQALEFISEIFSSSFLTIPEGKDFAGTTKHPLLVAGFIVMLLVIEWLGRDQQFALSTFGLKWPRIIRYSFYYILIFMIVFSGGEQQAFIYFQF